MTINILIRTSNRPIAFNRCIQSINRQYYRKFNVIVGNDSNEAYCNQYNPVRYKPIERGNLPEYVGNARYFPYNLYLNELLKKCKPGWVMFLDDDDQFTDSQSLTKIMNACKHEDRFVLWKVDVAGKIVPEIIGERPKPKKLSMIGFAFHTKYIPIIKFAPYKQADFRLANLLYSICHPIWINEVLTQTQGCEGMGNRIDF